MKWFILFVMIFAETVFASDRSEVDKNLSLLLRRTRQNAKYHFSHKKHGDVRSKYERLIMKNKPAFEELVNELNIYKEIKARDNK